MTTWFPCLLVAVLVAVEARRLLLGHLRRERRRALLARATVVTLGLPAIFLWSVGMDVEFFMLSTDVDREGRAIRPHPFEWVKGYVIKIDYLRGKLWCLDA